ncbi:MAG: alpha/beta hydrolase [Bacteroidales bacterium]|nr:alpha/beta hydrolase [Bacteroidales bacterium]
MEYFSTINGLPIHISDTKEGESSIVLLHGYLETLYIWENLTSLLSKKMRVISIDIPGHGLSGSREVNTMEFCADVVNSLLENLKIEKASILGHSMGGYVALEAVKKYPQRFSSLIMMHSSPFADSPEKIDERKREILLIRQNKLLNIAKLSVPKMFAKQNVSKKEEKIFEIIEVAEIHDPEGVVAVVEGMMQRVDNTEFLKTTQTPVLYIFGKYDNYIPQEAALAFLEGLKEPHYLMLENSGHIGFEEETQLCLDKIVDFLLPGNQ